MLHDPQRAGEVLADLKALGVGLALDDFGTGYSSLEHLKRLPVSELKIDKSFVMTMDRDPADRAIVASTAALGRSLGLRVVAEGVESRASASVLAAIGCDLAQGFYYSPPVPADQLPALVRAARDAQLGVADIVCLSDPLVDLLMRNGFVAPEEEAAELRAAGGRSRRTRGPSADGGTAGVDHGHGRVLRPDDPDPAGRLRPALAHGVGGVAGRGADAARRHRDRPVHRFGRDRRGADRGAGRADARHRPRPAVRGVRAGERRGRAGR